MTLTEEILTILTSYHKGYRLMRMRMHGNNLTGIPSAFEKIRNASDNTLSTTLSRLKRAGLIENTEKEKSFWRITQKGKNYIPRKRIVLPQHTKAVRNTKSKNMIIAFDIPEIHRRKRAWLRIELINLGFELMQESMWFGPSPLPKKFVDSLQKTRILPYMKFFEAKEADIV